jgi:hypothetical protein
VQAVGYTGAEERERARKKQENNLFERIEFYVSHLVCVSRTPTHGSELGKLLDMAGGGERERKLQCG